METTGRYRLVLDFNSPTLEDAEYLAADPLESADIDPIFRPHSALYREESGFVLWAEPAMTHEELAMRRLRDDTLDS